ncbi:MAG: folate-binding protein [Rhodoferax sp.]|uniref:CAF17-like 4Fe-4S cluster assembly/insertion protein YgfZ n=1 Tax=Rhodoferax sp. TaxID=50421 RepID=UPI0026305686|nr:folate-binding protein [Rhodoferax sp.]MDD5336139.1 folate-binding protein [Rhodoferax sp.]
MQIKLNGVAALTGLGVIRAVGVDAAQFLHGQLTQDFSLLSLTESRLAAFCSAKGRMLASFHGFKRSQTEILLICSRDILPATLKNLSRFVLRAKVSLSDASNDYAVFGLAGDAVSAITGGPHPVWSKLDRGHASVVFLYPAEGVPRALWLAPVTDPAPAGSVMSPSDWSWGEVRSGIAMITLPVVEAFVPQMLNYESVGGVNFKKGCYPGQEVVARSQFRGTLKRRAFAAHSDAPMTAGDEVFQDADDSQPCGTVAQAAAAPSGGFDAIVSMQIAAAESGALHLGAANGPALVVAPPPYPLLADI